MKLRSITFRCTVIHLNRLHQAMSAHATPNRTRLISRALEEFLDFVEREDIRGLDLFDLVACVDSLCEGHPFSAEA